MISIAVMAHTKRARFIPSLLDALDRKAVVVWDRHNDRIDTGRRSLLAYDPAATHHVVIQDDAIPCQDLAAGLEQAVEHTGDHPLGLYFGATAPNRITNRLIASVADRDGYRWIRMEGPIWGVGVCIPTGHIEELLAGYDRKQAVRNYDARIQRWYRDRGVDCYYPWPSLVDHRDSDENPSLVPGRNTSGRVAFNFLGADRSAVEIDWDGEVLCPDAVTLRAKGIPMFTFRNKSTGQVINLEPDDTRINRISRMTHRWERIDDNSADPGDSAGPFDELVASPIPVILEEVGSDPAKAQLVMELEAKADKPRSTLMESLAQIVAGGEEE